MADMPLCTGSLSNIDASSDVSPSATRDLLYRALSAYFLL